MAIMIPSDGGYFDPSSKEKEMFDALSKLPNEYYVFHSYRLVNLIPDKGLNENEIDFLVFNPNYGCLFIECKNRTMRADGRQWQFLDRSHGTEKWCNMHDPFDQAFSGQHNLFNKFRELYPNYRHIINSCKFLVAVWLPKYEKSQITTANFGANITKEIIMTKEAMKDPVETEIQVSTLMKRMNKVHLICKYEEEEIIDKGPGYTHSLSHEDAMLFFKKVLCPTFKTIVNVKKDFEDTYLELLEEQYIVLNFLAHQRTAAISGGGGTGKTLVAVHRASLLDENGERVLFLCYNRNLCNDLIQKNSSRLKNVDFYTLDSLACQKCKTTLDKKSYYDLKDVLENEILEGNFNYKHIIVDEGQDFGRRSDNETNIKSDILELLSAYGAGDFGHKDTSFFIFYDKNQLVNTKELPLYLNNVDSKLTLYKNCRNTKNIATTAYSLITTEPIMHQRSWNGDATNFIFYSGKNELIKRLDRIIEELNEDYSDDRVIISCSDSLEYSALNDNMITDTNSRLYYYKSNKHKTALYTCPTFKGLEADTVIITDIANVTFTEGNCDFYVAASRAKKRLFIFIDKDNVDISSVLARRFPNAYDVKDIEKKLALAMHGLKK
ncbi:NERD domain-containing protein [Ruminococcus sp.]|uniref:nuclease-related domain-containing DEAD/DEAH box helicase n=1 Tax=Ruminococcus sp. TaxID=41978 RepID=UPI0025E61292|nr:NERD domain-containing protein [Ruminococcus sp.]